MTKKHFIIYLLVILIFIIGYGTYYLQMSGTKISTKHFESEYSLKDKKTKKYGVSASNPIAVQVGMDILERGGNAIDAAIAVAYALGVVEPYGSGIGGGGGMLIKPGDTSKDALFIDYREIAPSITQQQAGHSGVPGFVKGMEYIQQTYGSMEMIELIQPSITLAEDGFYVTEDLHNRLKDAQYRLPVMQLPHYFPNGEPVNKNDTLKQKDLAETLKVIKEKGADGFYSGEIAKGIINQSSITKEDMTNYTVNEQLPVYGQFSGYNVISAPPPFSGITLIQSLQLADLIDIRHPNENQVDFMYLISKITNAAYDDRFHTLGDPAFTDISMEKLTSKAYMDQLLDAMQVELNNPSSKEEEHESTTHFVVIDSEGTVVSVTNTLSNFFGAGTFTNGFFLNNNLDNFGKSQTSPNSYEPGKRSRTFTAPTIIFNDERVIGIGTPGGNRIPIMLVEVLIPYLKFNSSLEGIIEEPRFYAQEGIIYTETMYPPDYKKELAKRGYQVEYNSKSSYYGAIQALVIDYEKEIIYGAGDERRHGTWMVK